ncbi:Cytokine induced apoptosis inhibitor 1 [Carabus blaptoides fortunei]
MDLIKSAQNILVIGEKDDSVNKYTESLKEQITGEITTKTVSDVFAFKDATSKYDLVISGYDSSQGYNHDSTLLSVILKLLKPKGTLILRHVTLANNQFTSQLKLSGYVSVTECKLVNITNEQANDLKEKLNTKDEIYVIEVTCSKPSFEVGSSTKLSFAKPAAAVWKLDDTVDDEVETIDPDTLLDDDDLKKPDPSSLRVCGTTGKRKACKDCSCGLAEELDAEISVKSVNEPKSSCGSCYLGDAFRCASCPYLGMPAFKPGEKIQLAGNQLQSDI